MNNNRERKVLYLGAFMHDIGKAIQRASSDMELERYYGSHPSQGYQFMADKESLLKDIFDQEELSCFLKYIQAHHESGYFKNEERADMIDNPRLKCLATMVSRADNYSSMERDVDSSCKYQWEKQRLTPVYSVFNRISLDSNENALNHYHAFERLTFEGIFCKNIASSQSLGGMIDDFSKNMDILLKTKNIDNLEYGLNYLIYNYFWCIPANTKEEHPDVSLYDHLKTTSGIATCIYDYHSAKGEIEDYTKVSDDTQKRFRLLAADFSGIQKYIFDISGQEKAGKRIRARSFYVQMLLEDVKMLVLEKFSLPAFNVIFQSGGKFFILLPNLDDVEDRIKEIQNDIDKQSIARFNGEISLNLALSDAFSGKASGDGLSFQDFDKVLDNTLLNLFKKQKKPFNRYLSEGGNFILDNSFEGKSVCSLCRKFPVDGESGQCYWCSQDISLGTILMSDTSLFIIFSESGQFELFNHKFDIRKEIGDVEDSSLVIVLNPDMVKIQEDILSHNFLISYLGNYIPHKDFSEIVLEACSDKKDCGSKMLAVLKADVDNLGKIFSTGLKRDDGINYNTVSRQSTMSRMFDLFFAGYLNEIIKTRYSNCYILYSGGDDLVIIGPWDRIIALSKYLYQEFNRYVNNPEITLSAGISLFKHNYPIYRAVEDAEKLLEKAKTNGKDSISLFGQELKWSDFNMIYPKEMNKVDEWLSKGKEDGGISTQFVRNLLTYGEMINRSKDDPRAMMWQPLFAYNIGRNLNKESEIWGWAVKVSGMEKVDSEEGVFKIIKDNLSLIAQYSLYRNRK